MESTADAPQAAQAPAPLSGRRGFFRWLTAGVSALAAAAVGLPLVGYIFRARERPVEWVPLGPLTDFPRDETRLVTFRNPIRQPWDGLAAHIGVYVRSRETTTQGPHNSSCWPRTVRTWVARFRGFPSPASSCAPAMAGCITATGERASGPPPRGLFRCVWRIRERAAGDRGTTLSDVAGHASEDRLGGRECDAG